jgi:putative flippase GtrA
MSATLNQLFRYVSVGVLNTLLGYCVIFACMYLAKMSPEASNAAGYAVGLVLSYVLNRNFTFRSTQAKRREAIKFISVFAFAYALNYLALLMFVYEFSVNKGASQVLAGVVYVGASFLMNKYFVFSTQNVKPEKPFG